MPVSAADKARKAMKAARRKKHLTHLNIPTRNPKGTIRTGPARADKEALHQKETATLKTAIADDSVKP